MALTVIVTWYGNDSERTSLFDNFTFDVLKQTARAELILAKDEKSEQTAFERIADKVITLPNKVFNKAWFINCAARQASNEWLLVLDADLSFDNTFFERVMQYSQTTKSHIFVPFTFCKWVENRSYRMLNYTEKDYFGLAFCIKKDKFFELGGICENFFGYGGEDEELGLKHKQFKEYMEGIITHQDHARNQPIYQESISLINAIRKNQKELERRQVEVKDLIGNPKEPTLIAWGDL